VLPPCKTIGSSAYYSKYACFQLAQGKFSSHGKNIHLYYLPRELSTQMHLHEDYQSLLGVSADFYAGEDRKI